MTIEARMALALEELDELLGAGVALEDALNAAALNQAIMVDALLNRATRTVSIEGRQKMCLARVEAALRVAAEAQNLQKPAEQLWFKFLK